MTCILPSLILLFVATTPTPRREVARIEKTCGAAIKRGEKDKSGQILLGETSGAVYPTAGEGTWRIFANGDELKKYSDNVGVPNTQATVPSLPT